MEIQQVMDRNGDLEIAIANNAIATTDILCQKNMYPMIIQGFLAPERKCLSTPR